MAVDGDDGGRGGSGGGGGPTRNDNELEFRQSAIFGEEEEWEGRITAQAGQGTVSTTYPTDPTRPALQGLTRGQEFAHLCRLGGLPFVFTLLHFLKRWQLREKEPERPLPSKSRPNLA